MVPPPATAMLHAQGRRSGAPHVVKVQDRQLLVRRPAAAGIAACCCCAAAAAAVRRGADDEAGSPRRRRRRPRRPPRGALRRRGGRAMSAASAAALAGGLQAARRGRGAAGEGAGSGPTSAGLAQASCRNEDARLLASMSILKPRSRARVPPLESSARAPRPASLSARPLRRLAGPWNAGTGGSQPLSACCHLFILCRPSWLASPASPDPACTAIIRCQSAGPPRHQWRCWFRAPGLPHFWHRCSEAGCTAAAGQHHCSSRK